MQPARISHPARLENPPRGGSNDHGSNCIASPDLRRRPCLHICRSPHNSWCRAENTLYADAEIRNIVRSIARADEGCDGAPHPRKPIREIGPKTGWEQEPRSNRRSSTYHLSMSRRRSGHGGAIWAFPLVLLLADGCGHDPLPEPAPRIVLERAERPGYWSATYELSHETGFLCFQRPAAYFRESAWSVVTPGWSFDRLGDRQTLVATPGSSAARVVVEFPVYTDAFAKEYEFFRSFTDGSVAIYSGHLYASRTKGVCPEDDHSEEFVRRMELKLRDGERLIVQGVVSEQGVTWDDPHGEGTYIYYGGIEPLETDAMVAIIDPGAPGWLVERMNASLPEIFRVYAERFGEPLPWKPVILFNFVDVEMSRRLSAGGTLAGLVQMSAEGSAWHQATPEAAEELFGLTAHEAVHLWNGQLHDNTDSADSWMHEGSADAFAGLMLHRSGYIGDDRLAERRTQALNKCALGLRDGPLVESERRRHYDNYYACGEIIAAWSVAAVSRPSDPKELFDLWRTIFEFSDPQDQRYSRETYLDALVALGADAEALEQLRQFVDDTHADPSAALATFLRRVGIEISQMDRHLPALRRSLGAGALTHLMSGACSGRSSYYTEGRRLRTEAIEDCAPFARPLRVVSIAGYTLASDGDLALSETVEQCRRGRPVVLGLEDEAKVEVPCTRPPEPVPTPLAFPRL